MARGTRTSERGREGVTGGGGGSHVNLLRGSTLLVGIACLAIFGVAEDGELWLATVGFLLSGLAVLGVAPRSALLGGGVLGIAIAALVPWRAGPIWTLAPIEAALLSGFILATGAAAATVAFLFNGGGRFGKLWASLAVVACAAGLAFCAKGSFVNITATVSQSYYVPMRDEVRLAVTVYRSRDMSGKLPTILLQTPYHRAQVNRFPYSWLRDAPAGPSRNIETLVRHGYAYVTVDVRGTGASFGSRTTILGETEIGDGVEIVDWIVRQPWSNGRIGLEGVSYNGTVAELLLARRHPAIKAVTPQFTFYDAFPEIVRPGVLFPERFARVWADFARYLDSNTLGAILGEDFAKRNGGIRPVNGDRRALQEAIAEHARNFDPYESMRRLQFKDQTIGDFSPLQMSPFVYQEDIKSTNTPIYSVSGWLDGAYQYGAIKRFLTVPNAGSRLLIGPWDHGGRQNISPCGRRRQNRFDSRTETLRFFDYYLKEIANGFADEPPVRYFTMCAEQWRSATSWPPAATNLDLYLSSGGSLTLAPPRESEASDQHAVAIDATSGTSSRWVSYVNIAGARIGYPDRREQDERAITYTSAPLEEDREVTGHPLVTIYLASDQPSGQFFVYLEDVSPSGDVVYVTEGQLDLQHRRLSTAPAPYALVTPYRSFARADAEAMTPGTVEHITVDLWPTSYLFRKGHRIRVALAGADVDNFAKPEGPAPNWRIFRDVRRPSRIMLPVVDRAVQ